LEDQDVDDLIGRARLALSRGSRRRPADAAEVAIALFRLSKAHHAADDPRVAELREQFDETFGDIEGEMLPSRVRYASRLASGSDELIYEDMHKLFSLLDDIYQLSAAGYSVDESALQQMDAAVRERFALQPKVARLVAEDKVKDWKRSLWWYADNLRQ
jgi:hypothetical protein